MLYVANTGKRKNEKWESAIELKLAWNNVSKPIVDDGSLFENPIFDFCLLRVSVFLTHLRAHKTAENKRGKIKKRPKCLLIHSSIYAAKREENWSWRQKHKQHHRAGEREKKVKRTVKHFYFFSCFAFACACCVKRAITRRKEKNEKYLVKKNVETEEKGDCTGTA